MGGVPAAVTAVFTVIAALLQIWAENSPQRAKEKRDAEIQQGRTDIANGNVAAVNQRLDRVLTQDSSSCDAPEQSGGEVTSERISAVLGLAPGGRSDGETTGKS